MDISGVSTSLNTKGLSSAPARADVRAVDEPPSERAAEQGIRGKRGLALGILRQELVLRAWFRARSGYTQAPVTADDVAEQALGAAKQAVAESPSTASRAVISFRARVEHAASCACEALGQDDDIDDVVAKLGEGLDELESEVEGYRESSASVLAIDTRTKQRSTIRIRTQEGDVVRLSLNRVDSLSATDVAYSDGEVSASSTEIALSSRSRMVLKVEGDLNDAELEAIRNVFAQAEAIADEFFGGDIGAAFSIAQGFEFDTEQLARVNMRFRMREISNIAYAETVRTLTRPESQVKPAVAPPAEAVDSQPVDVGPVLAAPVAEPPPVETAPKPVADVSAFETFFETLGAFLRSVGEGFRTEDSSLRFHYSESFKLQLLGAVLHTLVPQDEARAGDDSPTKSENISLYKPRAELL